MIDRTTISKIMDATDIVDVVSEFVSLRKSGQNYKGLCPFHNEKTPSFYVSPARGICHCFGCGKGGNAVNFLMELQQMTYPEALRWLARKYNIEIQERELTAEEREEESERESMFIVNEWAMGYFEDILHNDVDGLAIGMQYFRSRGFRDDIIRKFHLGFCPANRTAMSTAAVKKGYKAEFLTKTGLSFQRDNGELIDRYSGRVIFPWISRSGKVIAFGGRVLDARTKGVNQKYVNSPDSDIYHKDHSLYGIYQAKKAIVKENLVYMVEGYTDVISMHQCGIENVVANSGTALSVYQIRMLHRFTPNIVLLYDGDAAGIHAAMRGTDMLLQEGMNIKVLLLPDGNDPDSFARSHTAEQFRQYVESHQTDFIEFKTNLLLRGVTDPIKRSEAINSIVRSVSVITDQIIRATYIHDCSVRLGINEATLISTMNKFIREGKNNPQPSSLPPAPSQGGGNNPAMPRQASPSLGGGKGEADGGISFLLAQMIIRHGSEMITVSDNEGNDVSLPVAQYIALDLGADNLAFAQPIYNEILAEAVEHLAEDGFNSETYFINHPNVEISRLAAQMVTDPVQLSKSLEVKQSPERLRNDVLRLVLNFRMDYVERHLKELLAQISQPGLPQDKLMELMQEYERMQQVRNVMAQKLGNDIVN